MTETKDTDDGRDIEIRSGDLPLHCPPAGVEHWNLHPRVFLAIDKAPEHRVCCPYCGARYRLVGPLPRHH